MSAADKRDSVPADDAPSILPVDVATATEATLMDMVLGLPGVASRVLPVYGLLELARLSPFAIAERADVALPEAMRLAAAFEIGRRLQAARVRRPKRLRTARDVARFFHPQLAPLEHEEVWLAALDARDGGLRDLDDMDRLELAAHRMGLVMTHHVIVTAGDRWAAVMGQVRKPLS